MKILQLFYSFFKMYEALRLNHKIVLSLMLLFFILFFGMIHAAAETTVWKGNTHCHSWWSDGDLPPELVIAWYQDRGYQFLILSDHHALQQGERWKTLDDSVRTQNIISSIKERWGENAVEIREKDGKKHMRLKTIDELLKMFNIPGGKFLLIPGHEINGTAGGRTLHANVLNTDITFPWIRGKGLSDTSEAFISTINRHSKETGRIMLYHVNHPQWPRNDISPEHLAVQKDLRHYELCNVDSPPKKSDVIYSHKDKFFDILTTLRLKNSLNPIYGIASDDAHHYVEHDQKGGSRPCYGWIMVMPEKAKNLPGADTAQGMDKVSNTLSTEALFGAMNAGAYYCSTGVTLDDILWEPNRRAIKVMVHQDPGVKYVIEFFGTKKKNVDDQEMMGEVFLKVEGTEAEYILSEEDLYVRVRVTSDRKILNPTGFIRDVEEAWTQPVW